MANKAQPGGILHTPQAEKLLRDRAALEQLLRSPDTRTLMAMLERQGGLQAAAEAALRGDPAQLQRMVGQVMGDPATPPDLGGLLGTLTGGESLDPRLLELGVRLLSEWNRPDDRRTALLAALRPYVKPERYAKVDRAIRIAKLSRLIRAALSALREGGEDV